LAMPTVLSITATDDRNTVRLQTLDSAGLVSVCWEGRVRANLQPEQRQLVSVCWGGRCTVTAIG
jgi:hypothetical protein